MNAQALLPDDVARCAGRIGGLGPDDEICARRSECLRFRALLAWPADVSIPRHIPVHTALCRDGVDWMIGGQA